MVRNQIQKGKILLCSCCRLQKRLRKKNKSQIELEQKEQGFSLYVNGPHKDGRTQAKTSSRPTIPTQPKTGRKPKTAGGMSKFLVQTDEGTDEGSLKETVQYGSLSPFECFYFFQRI